MTKTPTSVTETLALREDSTSPVSVLDHPDVKYVIDCSANFGVEGATHVFWANDVDRNADGSIKTHHGKEVALAFQAGHPEMGVHLMQNYEGRNGVLDLYEYERKTDVPKDVIRAVCAFSSISFAKRSSERIITSVKGASIGSYFRTVELPVIMRSSHIEHVHNISREDQEGKTYTKKMAYHVLRDEWLEASKKRFLDTEIPSETATAAQKEVYNSALRDFAKEIALSKYLIRDGKHPYGLEVHARYNHEDRELERARWAKCEHMLEDLKVAHPALERAVKKEFYSKMGKDIKQEVKKYMDAMKVEKRLSRAGLGRAPGLPKRRSSVVRDGRS